MIPFSLFIVTGAATGYLTLYTFMAGVWGAPTSPIQCVSFAGSLGLGLSALISIYSLRLASRIALASSAIIWLYYCPAAVFTTALIVREAGIAGILSLLPTIAVPAVLLLETAYSLAAITPSIAGRSQSNTLFPQRVKPASALAFFACAAAIAGAITAFPIVGYRTKQVTHLMNWRCDPWVQPPCKDIILTYKEFPHRYERITSPQLYAFLSGSQTTAVEATFAVRLDFGRVDNYNMIRVGNYTLERFDWSGGGYGCTRYPTGSSLEPCLRGEEPWGEEYWWGGAGMSGSCGREGQPRCGHEDPRLASPWE